MFLKTWIQCLFFTTDDASTIQFHLPHRLAPWFCSTFSKFDKKVCSVIEYRCSCLQALCQPSKKFINQAWTLISINFCFLYSLKKKIVCVDNERRGQDGQVSMRFHFDQRPEFSWRYYLGRDLVLCSSTRVMFKFSEQVESLCTTFLSVQKVNSSLDM